MSVLAEKLIGAFSPPPELSPAVAWICDRMREQPEVAAFCASQPERLSLETLQCETLGHDIVFTATGHVSDHESTHLLEVEVRGSFDPTTRTVTRLNTS